MVGSLIVSNGTEYVGVILGVGVWVMDSVGVRAGWGVSEGVLVCALVCAAVSVRATMVAACSSKDCSEGAQGKLQAESSTNKRKRVIVR